MCTNDVYIQFSITFDYQHYYSEDEIAQDTGGIAALVAGGTDIEGALEVMWRETHIQITDQLAPWVQNLCYLSIPTLARGENLVVSYIMMPGVLTLVCDGEWIELSSNHFETLRLPRVPLLTSLINCGHRFEAFATEAKRSDKNYLAQLVDFPRYRQLALKALELPPSK